MEKQNSSSEKAQKEAHLHLAKALEALDLSYPKTQKTKMQMSIIALMGLGFELGLEKVIVKSLGGVSKAMFSLKEYFIDGNSSMLAEALEIAKKKDRFILSKFLALQDKDKEKAKLMDWLDVKIKKENIDKEELAREILSYLNKIHINLDKQNLN